MYLEMAPIVQLHNTFRNRWCGAYWASRGLRTVPSVNWGDETTFDFCFEGIEQGSVVAVSTYMASEHNNRQDQKEWFMAGYNELLRRIEPEYIICYNTPFPEMEGNIIPVDYDLSSWRYMQPQKAVSEDLSAYQIGGQAQIFCDTMDVYKIGSIIKGGGSAFGGEWKPSKPEDNRFFGEPNTIGTFYKQDGTMIQVNYGDDGRAVKERHNTTHNPNNMHSNPHDHLINWVSPRFGMPNFGKPINYFDGNIPEFKLFRGGVNMCEIYLKNTPEENRFETISEFKECIIRGGEPIFTWNGIQYGVFFHEEGYCIAEAEGKNEMIYDTPDNVLEYMVGNDRLRDVITQVTVIDRTV